MVFLSLLLQCKFANSTVLPLLSFSYFITPYDAQASSAFSALIPYLSAFSGIIWFAHIIFIMNGLNKIGELRKPFAVSVGLMAHVCECYFSSKETPM